MQHAADIDVAATRANAPGAGQPLPAVLPTHVDRGGHQRAHREPALHASGADRPERRRERPPDQTREHHHGSRDATATAHSTARRIRRNWTVAPLRVNCSVSTARNPARSYTVIART